ncbi:hypothetical protein SK128_016089 [Halocaridina rubra]|uniref:Ig-like domain-containing protein n=1 Tax=Halocaridina rubra TaxID=373956 RepID=A0AAN9AH73_HALRR
MTPGGGKMKPGGEGKNTAFGFRACRWKEETKWKTSSKSGRNEHARKGPHLLPGLPTNVSVTTGGLVTLPCRLANLKGRSVSRTVSYRQLV